MTFPIMFFFIFSLYFHNQEKGLVWYFHQLPIHQQNEWNRLNHLEMVAKTLFLSSGSRLTAFIHASLSCLLFMGLSMRRWFKFKAVPFLFAVTFSFKAVFSASFFFPFIDFISTIRKAKSTTNFVMMKDRY